MRFREIRKDQHYIQEHEREVPWNEVISVITTSMKNLRKKGNKFEIENESYYILCEWRNPDLYVINAKRKQK